MKTRIHYILALLITLSLNACNSGSNLKMSQDNINTFKNGSSLSDVNILGDQATYDTKIPSFNSTSCLNTDNFDYSVSQPNSHRETIIRANNSSLFNSFLANASVSGAYSVFKASLSANYENSKEIKNNSMVIDIISTNDSILTMSPKEIINKPTRIKDMIEPDAAKFIGNDAAFKHACNSGYVRSISAGVKIVARMAVTFNSEEMKNRFAAGLDVSVSDIAKISAALETFQKNNNTSTDLTVSTYAYGATGPVAPKDLGSCIKGNIAQCADNLNQAVLKAEKDGNVLINNAIDEAKKATTLKKAKDALSKLYVTGNIQVERYPDAILSKDIKYNNEQKQLQESVELIFKRVGLLNNIINIAITNHLQDNAHYDLVTLNEIGQHLNDALPDLATTCFGWDTEGCKNIFNDKLADDQINLAKLLNKYSSLMPEYGYYSKNNQIYFIPKIKDNVMSFYPLVLNREFDNTSGDYYYNGTNNTNKKHYIKPGLISEFQIKNNTLIAFLKTDESFIAGNCKNLGKDYSCTIDDPKLDPDIFGTFKFTNDTAATSLRNIRYLPTDSSLEHTTDFSSMLYMKRTVGSIGNKWCANNDNNCLFFDEKHGYIISSEGKEPVFKPSTDAIATAQIKIEAGDANYSNKITSLILTVNDKTSHLASIFTPDGESVVFRVHGVNLVAIPAKLLNNLHQANKDEYEINDLIRQKKLPVIYITWDNIKNVSVGQKLIDNVAYGSAWNSDSLKSQVDITPISITNKDTEFKDLTLYNKMPIAVKNGYIMFDNANGSVTMYSDSARFEPIVFNNDALKNASLIRYQTDGNLVAYDSNDKVVLALGTYIDGYRGSKLRIDVVNKTLAIIDNNGNKLCYNHSCINPNADFITSGDAGYKIKSNVFSCNNSNALRFVADNDTVKNNLLGIYISDLNKFYNVSSMYNIEIPELCTKIDNFKKIPVRLVYKDGMNKSFNVGTYSGFSYSDGRWINDWKVTNVAISNYNDFSLDLANLGDQDYFINNVSYRLDGGGLDRNPNDGKAAVYIHIK